ncbi:hypothetical protein [Parapedobacter sp. 2B3]|uniref:hypothetical protein n=1 Tax=Parapedobacter sp. 2B3 TaxID=3342381 RepID=UPI0035B66CC5
MMSRWRRKYKGMVRRLRKRHPLPLGVHVLWLSVFGIMVWYYYRLFGLVSSFEAMVYFIGLQVLYLYLMVFVLLPLGYHAKRVWLSVAVQVLMFTLAFLIFAAVMIAVSIVRGKLMLSLDFGEPFFADIVNFGEMTFVYMALSPINALAFFYVERFVVKKHKNRRLWLWHHDAHDRIGQLAQAWRACQLDPHLLGNLMTVLRDAARSQSREKLVKATTYVGNLMRFYTQQAGSSRPLRLREELRQVRLLLAIHRLAHTRGGATRYIKLVIEKDVHDVAVLPMTVLVLVENILHHASCVDRRHPAAVEVFTVHGGVRIVACNAWDGHTRRQAPGRGNGIAVANIRQRLRTAHPRASLETGWREGRFTAAVFIPNDFVPSA